MAANLLKLVFLCAIILLVNCEDDGNKPKIWALLVAGSNGYDNYRHQSDVCHAYQILHTHGIPDEQIVVMMYDDIANNDQNPDKGTIINRPNGPNVYPGVPKDYTKDDVTPEMFLAVLQGNKTAVNGRGSGKVIDSGPNDHIFINMVDHGAPGIFAFPSTYLYVKPLNDALKKMNEDKRYKAMVIYMESCESGSMFSEDLPSDISIYATTAANPDESSYACYFDSHLETYLGDVYSVKWMEDSDTENLHKETLHKQYAIVKKETNTSHVMQYGNLKMANDHVDQFQGNGKGVFDAFKGVPITDAVPSEDVELHILLKKIYAPDGKHSSDEIDEFIKEKQAIIDRRIHIVAVMEKLASMSGSNRVNAQKYFLTTRQKLTAHDCYRKMVDDFNRICFAGEISKHPFAMRQLYVLVNMCEDRVPLGLMRHGMHMKCTEPL